MRSGITNEFRIIECVDDNAIFATFSVMKQLRSVEESTYISTIRQLMSEGYHLIACLDLNNVCRGIIGYNVCHRLHVGKMIYVADLVVDDKHRSCGYGKKLLDWVKTESIRINCNAITLDSGVQRASAHKFYFNNDFEITSYNFKFFNPRPKSQISIDTSNITAKP
jgi:GNAT superfamily N-acetyltransferase